MLKTVFAALALSMLVVMGCSKESAPAKDPQSKDKPAEENTFTLKVPTGATNITQGGEGEAVEISVDRGEDMKGAIPLTFKPPAGITIEPASTEIPADKDGVEVTVKAAADTATGEQAIPVTAKVGEKEASETFKVEVKEP
jgi:uncharacterized membrane protein